MNINFNSLLTTLINDSMKRLNFVCKSYSVYFNYKNNLTNKNELKSILIRLYFTKNKHFDNLHKWYNYYNYYTTDEGYQNVWFFMKCNLINIDFNLFLFVKLFL